jgi:hypothetical protein
LQPPTADEARDVLDITDELLHQLFTSPARSERLRSSRGERRQPSPGGLATRETRIGLNVAPWMIRSLSSSH